MAEKPESQDPARSKEPLSALAQQQEAGMSSMMGLSTAWMEALSDMSAEVASFVAERIKEDVKTQHEILHCKNAGDLQQIQAKFLQKAIDQYQAETGKLVQMGTSAFAPKDD